MEWFMGAVIIYVIIMLTVRDIRRMNETNQRLGVTMVETWRLWDVNYLGGHPRRSLPEQGCNLVFTPTELGVEKGSRLLFRIALSDITSIRVETEEEVRHRITATRFLATGLFALAIPKKTPGSVLINIDTAAGPLAFEKVDTTKPEMLRALASQIVRIKKSSTGSGTHSSMRNTRQQSITDGAEGHQRVERVGVENISDADLVKAAKELVVRSGDGSPLTLWRNLDIRFTHAERIIDQLESMGVVGPSEGSKPRAVLISLEDLEPRPSI